MTSPNARARAATFIAILVPILIAILNTAVLACPLCKNSVPASDAEAGGSLPNGINNSVYFMLVGFFIVLGLVSSVIVKGVRDANLHSNPNAPEGQRGFPVD